MLLRMSHEALLLAGVPASNPTLYHRIRLPLGDSAAFVELPHDGGRTLLVRAIEMDRARAAGVADRVASSTEFAPAEGLSPDRDAALAQAVVECLRRAGADRVVTDRTLPYLFVRHLQQAGIALRYDPELGVRERRTKTDAELDALARAQAHTEAAMEMACRLIGTADARGDGTLQVDGAPLTSERVQRAIGVFLMERGCSTPHGSIVASLPHVADCHHPGTGPLSTGLPVVIDIFPREDTTRYWGDCTRTVVHGEPSAEVLRMHAAVIDAKAQATAAIRPGATGHEVHQATIAALAAHGYPFGPAPPGAPDTYVGMRHGTGHGIGLDVHEPILLSDDGEAILAGEVFTVEPGLYSVAHGGVRVEDMVLVADDGPENFNRLPEGLGWG